MTRRSFRRNGFAIWIWTGLAGGLISCVVLGALSKAEGRAFHAFLNATSHWLHGPAAAGSAAVDFSHTVVGFLTHVAACFFWGGVGLGLVYALRQVPGAPWIAGLGTAALAGLVDYGLLPRALSPGWHLVLSPVQVGIGFAAMGAGIGMALAALTGTPEGGKVE